MNGKDKNMVNFIRVWRQLSKYQKLQLYFLLGLMLFSSITEVFSIGAVIPFLGVLASPEKSFNNDLFLPFIKFFRINEPIELIYLVAIIFSFGVCISGLLRYFLQVVQTRVTYAIGAELSVRIFERALKQPYLVHLSTNSSKIISAVSIKANELIVSLLYPVVVLVGSIIMLGILFLVLISIDPLSTLSVFGIFFVFYAALAYFSKKRLILGGVNVSAQYNRCIKIIQESFGGVRDISLDGTHRTFINDYRLSEKSLRDSRANIQILSATPRYFVETFGTLLLVGLTLYLVKSSGSIDLAIPVIGAVALSCQRMIPIMQQLYSSLTSITGGQASVEEALDLIELDVPRALDLNDGFNEFEFKNEIQLREVSFRYGDTLPTVFNKINLNISKGSRIGVVGETGSGKTTFLDIVMGLIPPSEGGVFVDNVRLDDSNLRSWQSIVSHVPQNIYLMDSSIALNIAFGLNEEDVDYEKVTLAAKIAQIYDFIMSLPDNFGTNVGERGVRISGGQRQRIGIARAIYKNASVLILDEATSALDGLTEHEVMTAINALPQQITVFIVAHRYSTLKDCTSIVEISNSGLKNIDWVSLHIKDEALKNHEE